MRPATAVTVGLLAAMWVAPPRWVVPTGGAALAVAVVGAARRAASVHRDFRERLTEHCRDVIERERYWAAAGEAAYARWAGPAASFARHILDDLGEPHPAGPHACVCEQRGWS